jgi:cytoskeletal protein RodZ
MDEKKRASAIGIIIRFAILILILSLIAFFIIRWARNRNKDTEPNRQAHTTQQTDREQEPTPANEEEQTKNTPPPTRPPATNPNPTPTPPSVPSTGMGESVLLTALLIALSTYLFVKLRIAKNA